MQETHIVNKQNIYIGVHTSINTGVNQMKENIKSCTFIGKIWKTGNSAVVAIPSARLSLHELKVGNEYEITIRKKQEV
jgi:hypothetical protein